MRRLLLRPRSRFVNYLIPCCAWLLVIGREHDCVCRARLWQKLVTVIACLVDATYITFSVKQTLVNEDFDNIHVYFRS
jgi:hypothetical protein